MVVSLDTFSPKEITAQDEQAGLCVISQYPTQAAQMISADNSSQLPSQYHDLGGTPNEAICNRSDRFNEATHTGVHKKRARLLEDECRKIVPPGAQDMDFISKKHSTGTTIAAITKERSHVVPDVAAAIEDLLEQTSKVRYRKFLIFLFIYLFGFNSVYILTNFLFCPRYKINDLNSPGRTGCEKNVSLHCSFVVTCCVDTNIG